MLQIKKAAEIGLCLGMTIYAACFFAALFLQDCSDLGGVNLVFGLVLSG